MRLSQLLSVLATGFLLPTGALAEAATEASGADAPAVVTGEANDAEALAWDRFDDPDFEPTAEDAPESAPSEPPMAAVEETPVDATASADGEGIDWDADAAPVATSSGVVLGPQGVDDQGRTGRLHTVARGDTLWDLSAAYLGTPWVWPSVWIDNDDIANPHLILPGDKIWITANEMRVVSDAEAESYLAPRVPETTVAVAVEPAPAFEEDFVPPLAALDGAEEDPSSLDAFPVAIPGQEPETSVGRQVTVARRETMGFVTGDDLNGASSIVESPIERTFLAEGDPVFLGMGEGDVEIGDEFTIFQVVEEVRDVETNRVLGYHVENLGWIEVKELTGDTSIAEIRQSYAEIRRGARVMPRKDPSRRVTTRSTPDAIEGQIVFLPSERTLMADGGYVYLNRGEFHGVEVGSELEVYDSGRIMNERERRVDVRTPDTWVATLVVVSVEPDSSVAFVLSADRELAVGDTVRPVSTRLARR